MTRRILALAAGLIAAFAFTAVGRGQETASVGIDTDATGNTATSLGVLELCRSVAIAEEFQVDVYISNVSRLSGFEFDLRYDPEVLQFVGSDDNFFTASLPDSNPLELSASTPTAGGTIKLAMLDFGPPETAYETGSGALVRVSFRAIAQGTSPVGLDYLYLTTRTDGVAGAIAPSDPQSGQYLGRILGASIAVDDLCEQPTETPPPITFSPTPVAGTSDPGASPGENGDTSSPSSGQSPGATGNGGSDGNGDDGNGISDSGNDDSAALIWGIAAAIILLIIAGSAVFAWRARRNAGPGA